MALTEAQKEWAVGGSIGAGALLVGYLLFRGRPTQGGSSLPDGRSHEEHGRRKKKHRHAEDQDDQERENDRGEYGGKKRHHHREHGRG